MFHDCHVAKPPSVINDADYMEQFSCVTASLSVILYDCHLNKRDSDSYSAVAFVDFQCQSLVDYQSVIVDRGVYETRASRSVTRAPAFIQFQNEDN